MARPNPHFGAERLHLLGSHQAGMIILVAGEGQSHALDGVGDETGGLVVGLGLGQRVQHRFDIVAAQIGHQPRQLGIGQRIDDGANLRVGTEIDQQGGSPGLAALEGQRGIKAVRAIIDPVAQRGAARPREGGFLQPPMLYPHDVPAHIAEQPLEPSEQTVLHHAVETLAVVIDDPPDIADVVLPAFQQGFVNIALVQFRIAGDGDVPAGLEIRCGQIVQPDIILDQAGKTRNGHAQPDGACGKIHLRPILDPAGIGLGAAELPQPGHFFHGLPAEQIIGGVKHRAGMGLHRHPVLRPQLVEIQRGQDADDAGATGLVAADLQPVPVRPHMIGVVHHPGRQPEQLALDLPQRLQFSRCPGAARLVVGRSSRRLPDCPRYRQTGRPRPGPGNAAGAKPGINRIWTKIA